MNLTKHGTKKGILLAGTALILVFVIAIYTVFETGQVLKWRDLHRFSSHSYSAAFFATYNISNYSGEDFITYRGIPTLKAEYTIKKWKDMSKYLKEILSSENTVTNIYLGLDPVVLWEDSHKDEVQWEKNLERCLVSYVTARPDVDFEILFPSSSLQYWMELESDQITERVEVFSRFIDNMHAYTNVIMYFIGGEQWLISNPANYLEDGQTNQDVSRKIFLHVFCDRNYQITQDNAPVLFDQLLSLVEQESESPTVYSDLSEWCMVFFGESPLDYYTASYSITGVVNSLSGAQVYNCGKGGTPATEDPGALLSLNRMITRFLEQDTEGLDEDNNFVVGLKDYMQESHEDKKLCFVLMFGLNDYFGGHPVENPEDGYDIGSYAGALRTGISTLKEAYPDAEILVLAPTYTAAFSGGTEINSEVGGILTDYVDATVRTAEEMGVHCINNYADSGINADNQIRYLADGIHPNETGAFLLGTQIIEYMGRVAGNEE